MRQFLSKLIILCVVYTSVLPFAYAASDSDKLRHLFAHFFKPLTQEKNLLSQQQAKINLGRVLYFDQRISGAGNISCNSCHDLQRYGTNGDYFQTLKKQGKQTRDVPSLYNKANLKLLGWTGKANNLADYVRIAIQAEDQLAVTSSNGLEERLSEYAGYQKLFQQAYPNSGITFDNTVDALSTYVSGLVTRAPIDNFMAGDDKALTDEQVKGGLLFDAKYCHSCHTGTNFGGRMIQKMGVKAKWPNQSDLGYYNDTKDPQHKMFFRVSPLRNIEKTAPYFHDGSSKRMWDAIRKMGHYELGVSLSIPDALLIQSFFRALTGELPQQYIKLPKLPK